MTDVVTARPDHDRWTDAVICDCGAVVILAAAIPLHRMGDVHAERMTARVVVAAEQLAADGARRDATVAEVANNCNGASELPPVPVHRVPGYAHAMALYEAGLRIAAEMARARALEVAA